MDPCVEVTTVCVCADFAVVLSPPPPVELEVRLPPAALREPCDTTLQRTQVLGKRQVHYAVFRAAAVTSCYLFTSCNICRAPLFS